MALGRGERQLARLLVGTLALLLSSLAGSEHVALDARASASAAASAADLLAEGRALRARLGVPGTLRASAFFEQALAALGSAASGAPPPQLVARAELLEEAAELQALLRQPKRALARRREALQLRSRAGGGEIAVSDAVLAYAAMAQHLRDDGNSSGALELLARASAALGRDAPRAADKTRAVLLKLESEALECRGGRAADALAAFERSLALGAGSTGSAGAAAPRPSQLSSEDLLTRVGLLRRLRASGDAAVNASALDRRERASVRELLRRGPWTHPQQLPKEVVRGLSTRPWHSVAEHFPALAPVQALLEAAAGGLRDDLASLRARGRMLRETECINDAESGEWTWFATNGFWIERDAGGCSSADTPRACELLARIDQLGLMRVIRGSFSVLGPAAHLHEHCGTTTAQLKMHVGLEVPLDPATGLGCARIRVANETRRWEAGSVLFFDDSFQHEVHNDCAVARSVFQLVFDHPDLQRGSSPSTQTSWV